jgi:hypothetical protein
MSGKLFFLILFTCLSYQGFSQAEDNNNEERRYFKKEFLFAGGNLNLSFFNNTTSFGVNPHIGYSFAKWLDVAVSMNLNYISKRNYFLEDDKVRQIIYAPGAFVRLYPVYFLYAEANAEHNFIKQKFIPPANSSYSQEQFNYQVNTLLVGLGYISDRKDEDEYFYLSVSFDVLALKGSPYVNSKQHVYPVIKAGYSIRLFHPPKKRLKH